ncbi:hypothetical protein [Pseudogemmobacter faecipullorum]|uniref:Uncharacterized protein n=1 Tax=Pseudogemmobacter faecipullorum TaxID=2755041 RepID=A0ABS8CL20_9RHOB|nr:hypothetical protein [Pseudogemmobacter faecipullorum]MCB5409875.1 hypothetical protein [Pseudogemmobacter faecipullorum]
MDLWNYLELAAWAASAIFGLFILIDWIRTDQAYSEEFLTSSREGELEALTEEQHHHRG